MKVYGLIGYPLGHSFSKIFFTQKFKEEAVVDSLFELFPIPEIGLFPKLLGDNKDLCGLAVTKPYKESVMKYLTSIDEASIEIGAVNCIVIKNNELTGHNTDVIGFEKSLIPLLKSHHKKALVLGTGGASKGVQYVLKKNRIDFLTVSRNTSIQKGDICYHQIDKQMMADYNIIINCTPAGMSPDENNFPEIPYHLADERHVFYDLIYKPASTLFMQKALHQGAVVKNGHEMFLIQAEANWQYWTGVMK